MRRTIIAARRLGMGTALATALLVTGAPDAAAQEGLKTYLVDAFERSKTWDVSLVEAIPDSAMDWAPDEDVRGFAAQIIHAANNGFIAMPLFGEDAPEFGDAEALEADKAALAAAVGAAYDHLIQGLRAMPAAELDEEVDFFGRSMTKGRVALFALEHAMWTRGQLVPYLHAHGVAIPQQVLF